jgi:hypothetical protein
VTRPTTVATLTRLSAQQDAIVDARGNVTLVRGDRAWRLNDREAKRLLEAMQTPREAPLPTPGR